ncbi:hypothetical protein [Nocardia cyriacigeorgica]|uniref:hypothetical protein n=1 Tax=Nocardia cyriacigeorgica TaxID=135487 RepID=UPI002454BC03|nr:hypothetical protein [Nocardia cyriacigeorgica]
MKYLALPILGLIVSAGLVLATPWPSAIAAVAAVVVFGVLFAFVLGYVAGRLEPRVPNAVIRPVDTEHYRKLCELATSEDTRS